jgi:hypothetical protein
LIEEFVTAIKTNESYLEKSRKFNRLTKHLGSVEAQGLREAWAYFETKESLTFPYAFDDTINYLISKYKKISING